MKRYLIHFIFRKIFPNLNIKYLLVTDRNLNTHIASLKQRIIDIRYNLCSSDSGPRPIDNNKVIIIYTLIQ